MDLASPQFLHNPNATVSTVGYGDDRKIHAQFDDDYVKNEFKSQNEGRAVFDHFYCIELQYPGDNTKTNKIRFSEQEANRGNEWIERFPRQWQAFKSSTEQTPEGTPIEHWPPLDKKRIFELKAAKIYSVEQIAGISDANVTQLGLDGRKLRDQAKAFLNPEISQVQISKLMRENDDKDRRLEILETQLAALANGQPLAQKKRGPKPKLQIETQAA